LISRYGTEIPAIPTTPAKACNEFPSYNGWEKPKTNQ